MQNDKQNGSPPWPRKHTIERGSARFTVQANDAGEDKFWHKFAAGQWEPGTLDIIQAHVGPGVHFLDTGTWIGPTTLYAAALGATVTSLEADPLALEPLRHNIALNPKLAAGITVVPQALSTSNKPVLFGSRRKGGDSMSSLVHDRMQTAWEVQAITESQLAAHCPAGKPVFLKVDIEGSEYLVLPGASALFKLPLCAVHLSLHPAFFIGTGSIADRALKWFAASRATARMLHKLAHFRAYRCTDNGLEPAGSSLQMLARLGLCYWPLQGSWLFLPDRPSRSKAI